MLVTYSMRKTCGDIKALIGLNNMERTSCFKAGHSRKDIEKLFSLIVKMTYFRGSFWHSHLYYAEVFRYCKVPTVAVAIPKVMLSIVYGYDCHIHCPCIMTRLSRAWRRPGGAVARRGSGQASACNALVMRHYPIVRHLCLLPSLNGSGVSSHRHPLAGIAGTSVHLPRGISPARSYIGSSQTSPSRACPSTHSTRSSVPGPGTGSSRRAMATPL